MPTTKYFALTAVFALGLLAATARAQEQKAISISGADQMKYDTTSIDAQVDQTLAITLTNDGSMPKVAMAHNLVILRPGTDVAAFLAAAAKHPADEYFPAEMKDRVLARTRLLGPGESDTVTFTPIKPGTYEYLCTFPAHAAAGMRGVIAVK